MNDEANIECAGPSETGIPSTTSEIVAMIRLHGKRVEFDGYLLGELDERLAQLTKRCSGYSGTHTALVMCEHAIHHLALSYAMETNAHRSVD